MYIHHVAITVNSLTESLEFYAEKFDFELEKRFGKEGVFEACMIKLGNFRLELYEFPDQKDNFDELSDIKIRGIRHIAFGVSNLDKKVGEFTKKGLKFSEIKLGKTGHRYSFTKDPNGVMLEFFEES